MDEKGEYSHFGTFFLSLINYKRQVYAEHFCANSPLH